jgi:copper(I)-binding protein
VPLASSSEGTAIVSRSESPKRLRIVAGLAAMLALAGCGAGQNTQTDSVEPAVNGTLGQVGDIMIRDAQFAYPTGGVYPAGGEGPLVLTIVNTGPTDDELVSVSSSVAESVEVTGDRALTARRAIQVGTPSETVSGKASSSSAAVTTTTQSSSVPPSSGAPGSASGSAVSPTTTTTATPTSSAAPVEIGKATIIVKGFSESLSSGKTYPVTFVFRNAGSVTLNLPIAAPTTARPEPTGESHG